MKRFFLAAVCLAFVARPSLADLDAEVTQPYHLRVVLHVAKHRALTAVFKDRLKRDLHDGLQAALGYMADVEVVDRHPLLKKVEADGLQALDGWKEMSGDKLHFVLIDYVDWHYVIWTRQYDGSTGMASPAIRRERLQDPSGRPQVARTVIRMIDRDFGLVGTVDAKDEGPEVHVAFKGSRLLKKAGAQDPLARWVDKGDVLLVSKIIQRGTKVQSLPVDWALLQVLEAPAQGACRCHLYFRYSPNPLQTNPGVLGVRCLKVSTVKGRLRLRLIDDQAHAAKASQQVAVSGDGFKSNAAENLSSDNDGIVQTSETYQNVAFVEIKTSGGAVAAEVPVAMLGHGVVECPVSISDRAETRGGLELQKRLMLGQVGDSLAVAGQLFEELSRLVKDKSHEGALEKAGKGLKDLDADLVREEADRNAFLARAKELGLEGDVALTDGEQQLFKELTDRRMRLKDFVSDLKKTIRQEQDPAIREAQAMIQQGGLLEDQGEYDKALDLYAKALPMLLDEKSKKKLRDHADNLRKKWAPKSEKHKEARAFIYNEWPKLNTAQELKDNLQKAKDAREACKEAGDRLTLRHLYLASSAQLTGLENELAPLKSQQGEDAEKKRKLISEMSEAVYEFYKDVGKFLQSGKPATK